MKRKIIEGISVLLLICFSFYYTDRAVDIVKRNDPVMKEIISASGSYEVKPQDATLDGNKIIPGYNGKQININKSYSKMKQLGFFNDSLLVFDEVKPNVTLDNNYDKYVISGNELKTSVALVFKVKANDDISRILNTLLDKNVQATFFIDGIWLENNIDLVYSMIEDLHHIEILSYDGTYASDKMVLASSKLKELTKVKGEYCYTEYDNEDLLSHCSKEKKYTIEPTIISGNYPYATISNKLTNGAIISFNVNKVVEKELSPIINYIRQKGFKTETLNSLIKEDRQEVK